MSNPYTAKYIEALLQGIASGQFGEAALRVAFAKLETIAEIVPPRVRDYPVKAEEEPAQDAPEPAQLISDEVISRPPEYTCPDCGGTKAWAAKTCAPCFHKRRKGMKNNVHTTLERKPPVGEPISLIDSFQVIGNPESSPTPTFPRPKMGFKCPKCRGTMMYDDDRADGPTDAGTYCFMCGYRPRTVPQDVIDELDDRARGERKIKQPSHFGVKL